MDIDIQWQNVLVVILYYTFLIRCICVFNVYVLILKAIKYFITINSKDGIKYS